MAATPTHRKKRLGKQLADLRGRAGKSLADAGAAIRMDKSVVSKYESGLVLPSWTGLQTLLAFYDASQEKRITAGVAWEDAGTRSAIRAPKGSSVAFRAFLTAEDEAENELLLAPQVVPGILQTEGYAKAINEGGRQFHVASADQYVETRLKRRQRLSGEDRLKVHALIDEAAICRIVGSQQIMEGQLEDLLRLSTEDNVTIQVIPFSVGVYGNMCGEFIILKYPEPEDPPAAYITHIAGGLWVENEEGVKRLFNLYEEATERAANPSDTRKIIQTQLEKLRTNE